MKFAIYLLFVPLALMSCNFSKSDNTMSLNGAEIYTHIAPSGDMAWHTLNGKSNIDSTTLYKEGMHSLLLMPNSYDSLKICQTYFKFNTERIEGDSISFKGNFKVEVDDSLNITFGIQQILSSGYPITHTMDSKRVNEDSDWQEFTFSSKMDDNTIAILFFIYSQGDAKIWTSNWLGKIDDKSLNVFVKEKEFLNSKDTEFDTNSKMVLNGLTPQMVDNLEVLGKVWGFLKYYHPRVIRGEYNWDYELFRVLPQITNAKDNEERNHLLKKWIDRYGDIKEKEDFVIVDSTQYSRIIDLDWLNDESIFDQKLIIKLNDIKNAKRSHKFNYYMLSPQYGEKNANEEIEKKYADISWKDKGYRILTLFRLWNAVEYCAPYVELTDKPWCSLLKEYIPQFIEARHKKEYELSLLKLFSNVDESHGWINIPNHSLSDSGLAVRQWASHAPFKLLRSKEEKIVVSESQFEEFQRGDVIVKIEGRDIDELIKERAPYLATSNEATLYRDLLPYVLFFYPLPAQWTIERNGQQIEKRIDLNLTKSTNKSAIRGVGSYNLEKYNIGYIDVSKASVEYIEEVLERNLKGIILDMRIYPNMHAMRTLEPVLTDEAYPYVWFSFNDKSQVGNFKFIIEKRTTKNPNYYKGKVAIIVNEGTQSHGEFSSMAYRKAPRSAIIGSQTAGADGNIQTFFLPGGISITYTGLGTYYPNWEMCQRVGLKIDIPVRPTLKGIKEGKDELIEEAIQYITK